TLAPLRLPDDVPVLHDWVTRDYARFWGMQQAGVQDVEAFYARLQASGTAQAYLARDAEGRPAFLIECYDPAHDEVGAHYPVRPGDCGMHLLLAPCERPLPGFSLQAMRAVLAFLFADPQTRRVVVEPDLRNERIHRLNARVGFRPQRVIQLGSKQAQLAFCTRADHLATLGDPMSAVLSRPDPEAVVDHLQPQAWARANRLLLCKALAEFAHERLLAPEPLERDGAWQHYRLAIDAGLEYRFRARRYALEHWQLDPESLTCREDGAPAAPDAATFVARAAPQLGIAA
ncbi:GNAT family N-acetyltransferase, partial [Xanthomonas sp. Kuri4-1]